MLISALNKWKTTFQTRYESLVMLFGLKNAPATFQYFINDVLQDILDQYMVAYLDNILVFVDNLEQHTLNSTPNCPEEATKAWS